MHETLSNIYRNDYSLDIISDNPLPGYDSGVDCCERPLAGSVREMNRVETGSCTAAEYQANGIKPQNFYSNVAYKTIVPVEKSEASGTAISRQINPSQNKRQTKPVRRKKRRHLFTVRRRKNRLKDIAGTWEKTAGAWDQTFSVFEEPYRGCEQTLDVSEKCAHPHEQSGAAFDDNFGNIQGMTKNFALGASHQFVEISQEIADITDHVNDDIVHVTDECDNIIDSDQDAPVVTCQ